MSVGEFFTTTAFAAYSGMRAGEIRALGWSDVHEAEGFLTVRYSQDFDTGKTKTTKTGRVRRVPLEPALTELLSEMREAGDASGLVFPDLPHRSEWAYLLREDLKIASGDESRDELQKDTYAEDRTKVARKLDFHDLRHTYATWRVIRGDHVVKLRFALGHTDLATTRATSTRRTPSTWPASAPLPIACLVKRTEIGQTAQKHPISVQETASPGGTVSNLERKTAAILLCHVDDLGPTRARRNGR